MRFFYLSLFVACVAASCPEGSFEWQTDCYIFQNNSTGFAYAESLCTKFGGHLASIHDGFTNALLAQEGSNAFFQSSMDDFWIGLSNLFSSKNWTWMDQTLLDFEDWTKGEPSNVTGSSCATLSLTDGYWRSDDCFKSKPYVCKVEKSLYDPTTSAPVETTTTSLKNTTCPYPYVYFEASNSCYFTGGDSILNWTNGEAYCVKRNAHLASIHSDEEARFLESLATFAADTYWVGAFSVDRKQTWKWSDNTPWDYDPWRPNLPTLPENTCAWAGSSGGLSTMSLITMINDIEHLWKVAEDSRLLNQSEPKLRPSRNRNEMLQRWKLRSMESVKDEKMKALEKMLPKTTILSSDIYSSKRPFEELKPIYLCDMKVPMVHSGRYLVCQVIAMPSLYVGITALVQDVKGDVEEVAIYNFSYNSDDLDLLCPGTIFIIKEPWLRYGSHDKVPALRIDSPSDIIFVDPSDDAFLSQIGAIQWFVPMSTDPEEWRGKANECFKAKNFKCALKFYDRAIRCNPELSVLYLNKSATCIRMGAFYDGYEAAKIGLEKGGDREKALYRMGQAAYGMREWQKAVNHFDQVLKEFPNNTDASIQLKRASNRLCEQETGKFDFKMMFMESKKENAEMDVADYIGPVEIADIAGKGRGIIASKDIKRGTLLVVSKAFATGYSYEFPGILLGVNLIRKEMSNAAQMVQITKAMKNLQNNPQRAKEVYALDSGDLEQSEEIPFGVIDTARIQEISASNRFSSDDLAPNEKAEMRSLGMVASENCHLFIYPSYINHSCVANARRSFYGDVMVIHACMDIKKGDEICHSYISPLTDYEDRKKTFNCWKFECNCKLCEIEAKDKNYGKRNQIMKEFEEYAKENKDAPQDVIARGETVLKKIRETYTDENEYKITLASILITLSDLYFDTENVTNSIEYLNEVIALMDNPIKYAFGIVNIIINLAYCYLEIRKIDKVKEMVQKAYELSFCTDMDHFKLCYPEVARDLLFN